VPRSPLTLTLSLSRKRERDLPNPISAISVPNVGNESRAKAMVR